MQLTIGGASSRAIAVELREQGFTTGSQSTVVRDRRAVIKELRSEMKAEVLAHRAIMDARYKSQLAAHWTRRSRVMLTLCGTFETS